jgi:two-component system, cell cycle sensor histidine kinase and response regulator CckA
MNSEDQGPSDRRQEPIDLLRIQRDLSVALGACEDLEPALALILDAAVQMDGVDSGGIYVAEPTGALDLVTHRGLSSGFVDEVKHLDPDTQQARVANEGRIRFESFAGLRPEPSKAELREGLSYIAVIPVMRHGRLLTVMNLASHGGDGIPTATREALEILAQQVAATLIRLRATAALRESRRNLQSLFDSIEDFLFVLDGTGHIIETNAVVVRRLGYTRDELLGQDVLMVHPPERRAEAAAIIAEMLAGACDYCPVPLQAADGTLIPVETRVTTGVWSGRPALFGVSRDVAGCGHAEEPADPSD